MAEITILPSILDANDEDLTPVWGDDDESSVLPTLDVFFDSGVVELVHVGSVHDWLITQSFARFPMRQKVSAERFRDGLRADGELLALLKTTVGAASSDAGIIAACEGVNAYLKSLRAD
jgi:hypothetical protein